MLFTCQMLALQTSPSSRAVFHQKYQCLANHSVFKMDALNPDDPACYTPISNLNTTKIFERLFLVRLLPHILPSIYPLQFAYRLNRSTETALLKFANDISEAVETGRVTILVAIELSAAFDDITDIVLAKEIRAHIQYRRLISELVGMLLPRRTGLDVCRTVARTQTSTDLTLQLHRDPQSAHYSSHCSPTTLYMVTSFHDTNSSSTQFYTVVIGSSIETATSNLTSYSAAVYDCLLRNILALHPDSSESTVFWSMLRVKSLKSAFVVNIAASPIELWDNIKSLGVICGSRLYFDKPVNNVSKSCYFYIRIGSVYQCKHGYMFDCEYPDRRMQLVVGLCIREEHVQITACT